MEEKIINLSSTQGSENLPRPKPKRVRNHIKKHGRKYGLSIVSIAFILGIFFGAHLAVIYSNVQEIRRIAPSLPVLLQGRDFSDARELLQKIDVKLFGSQKLFNRIKIFENIPVIGKHLRGARDLVDAGTLASEAAIEASSFLAEIPYSEADGITYKDVDYSSREFILTRIEESQEVIAKILSNIQAARAKIANISEKDVAEIIVGNAERLDRKLAAAEKILINADPLIKIVPELAGFSQEKKYLFLLLNNDELRPTGGFVSAYGIIDIKNGTFTNFYLDDTWNLDKKFISRLKNQAPAPIVKYNYFHPWYPNTTGEWFFRDITGVLPNECFENHFC